MGRLQEPDMRTDILDAAEAIVRQHGFNGFHIEMLRPVWTWSVQRS